MNSSMTAVVWLVALIMIGLGLHLVPGESLTALESWGIFFTTVGGFGVGLIVGDDA